MVDRRARRCNLGAARRHDLTAARGRCDRCPVRMSQLLPIVPGEVHVWLTTPETITDPALLATYMAWMNPEEAARQARFLFDRHRHQFLVARALVRSTLSRYAALAPADWRFVNNAWGRPDIDPGHGLGGLCFNLSHTDGLVAVAVARAEVEARPATPDPARRAWPELGVDVEDTWRRSHTDQIAEHFFAPAEVAALRALPQARQHARFFELWTLKEAYIKARGMGLAISLHSFAYDLDGRGIGLTIDPSLGDTREGWQFHLSAPTERHRLALAVRFPDAAGDGRRGDAAGDRRPDSGEPAQVQVRTVVPARPDASAQPPP